jgi:hyperosmotically inducible protein
MNIRPIVLGITLTTAMLVAGCNQNDDAGNADDMNTGVTGTETMPPPADGAAVNSTDMDTSAGVDQTVDNVSTEIDDGVITTKVKSALLADDTVKGLDINVDTTQGTVRLSGAVDSQTQIDMAMQIAKGVEGVKDVQNELTVQN